MKIRQFLPTYILLFGFVGAILFGEVGVVLGCAIGFILGIKF